MLLDHTCALIPPARRWSPELRVSEQARSHRDALQRVWDEALCRRICRNCPALVRSAYERRLKGNKSTH